MKMKTTKSRVALIVLVLLAAATKGFSQEEPKVDLNALAVRGEALANADPLSAELRKRQPDDPSRRGFDIGMAAAEGQTLPGPGKQRLGASLPPDQYRGFNFAVSFSLERNRNADLAARGAAIAKVDERVSAARTADPDVFYWLGFDIATGIFGDPALGAKGNTAVGPGSLKIRDSLSPAGRRGFNASVKFHLGQAPPPTGDQRPREPQSVTPINKQIDEESDKALAAALKNHKVEPASDEIRCRGFRGVGMFTTEGSRVGSTGETMVTVLLTSEPSPAAAGSRGEGLRPGECAWVDRPIDVRSIHERWFLLRFETPANGQLKQTLHGTPVDTSPTAAERFPDVQTIDLYMYDPNHYWSFYGVKRVNNYFTATGHKYWKPPLVIPDRDRVLLPKKN